MAIFEVNDTGVHVPSLETALAATRQQMADIFGDDLAGDAQTPQGQLAGIIAILEAAIGEALVQLGNATSVDDAVGTQLDTLGELLDILRQRATRSRLTAALTGVGGTGVPAGSRAKTTADPAAEFRTIADAVLSPSPGVSVEMEAVEEGPVAAAVGTLTAIVTVIPGWETISNAAAATLGIARQPDPTYRTAYRTRTGHRALGPMAGIEAAIDEALAGRQVVKENNTDAAIVVQEFAVLAHHILVIAESGSDGDIRRAIENHRGMGVGTMTAIRGGAHGNLAALQAITNGSVTWNGTAYAALDLSGATDLANAGELLTAHLAADPTPPVVAYIDGRFVAQFGWQPTATPMFGTATVEDAFGLDPTSASAPTGPFIRTRERPLTVTIVGTRQPGFPGDGLNAVRQAVLDVVASYGVGEQAWGNDFLRASEGIAGTRITSVSVLYNSADASGVSVPLDATWVLNAADLMVTIP